MKLFDGFSGFANPMSLDLMDLKAKVDTPEWTMGAWVQLESEGGAVVVRKPLGKTQQERGLSCWSWYVGWPYDKFEYGAHDYGGGKYATALQETIVSSNATTVDDGNVHHVAVVVMQDKLQFWVDADMTFETALQRPVTDCASRELQVGSSDIPMMGEIVFYPHKLTQIQFKEIIYAGYTLEAINEGPPPLQPDQPVCMYCARAPRLRACVLFRVACFVSPVSCRLFCRRACGVAVCGIRRCGRW